VSAPATAGLTLALALAIGGGCATTASLRTPTVGQTEEGRASYYAHLFDGRRTASGERYDPERLTAAHPTLPFGTWIRVTRLDGPDVRVPVRVEVKVNDRCGCGGGRIVDLSRAAARRLDMLRAGIVPVRIEVIEKR
jgi:rare lipoprotein A